MPTPLLAPDKPSATVTLGVVSFLNARPLYDTLRRCESLAIAPAVPSRLAEMLEQGRCRAALLPIVDYRRRRERLRLVSDGCIASDGETLTVRVYSRVPPDQVRRLHVDSDSQTSIILAQVVWKELYGRRLELAPWPGAGGAAREVTSVLLIGDKVVRDAPRGFGFEVDLGAAWKHLTGLPFVFAAWYGTIGDDDDALVRLLREARDDGVASAREIAVAAAAQHGWPVELAVRYLCEIMRYTLTPAMREAMERFFTMADRHGFLP